MLPDMFAAERQGRLIMNENLRIERDSVGELAVPADAYYGVQSLRGYRNFRIAGFIRCLWEIS